MVFVVKENMGQHAPWKNKKLRNILTLFTSKVLSEAKTKIIGPQKDSTSTQISPKKPKRIIFKNLLKKEKKTIRKVKKSESQFSHW